MWIDPATVPPRKPSLAAVASSWIEPRDWAAELTGLRNSPVTSGVSVARLIWFLLAGASGGRLGGGSAKP